MTLFKKPSKLFLNTVALPFAAVVAYYGILAEPRYVTESRVALKSFNGAPSGPNVLSLLSATSNERQEELYLIDRVKSLDMAQKVDAQEALRDSWQLGQGRDILHRLWGSTLEDYLGLYRKKVHAFLDPVTNDLVLQVEGFDPKQTHRVSQLLVSEMEKFTNESNQALAREQINFVNEEVATLHKRFIEAKAEVAAFQQKNRILDADSEGKQRLAAIASLEAELIQAEAELTAAGAYLAKDSFQLKGLQQKVGALKSQIARERTDLTQGGNPFSDKMRIFQELKMKAELAEQQYRGALTTLETVRVESVRKARSLTVIASPHVAEKATFPRYGYELLVSLLSLLGVYGLIRMTRALLREHRN